MSNEGLRARAEKFMFERGTDKPYQQVAQEWREYEWTPEDCVRFANEITSYMADFAQQIREDDCKAICMICALDVPADVSATLEKSYGGWVHVIRTKHTGVTTVKDCDAYAIRNLAEKEPT